MHNIWQEIRVRVHLTVSAFAQIWIVYILGINRD